MPVYMIKYWKYIAVLLLLAAVAASCGMQKANAKREADKAYMSGYETATQEIAARLKDAAIKQAEEVRNREEKARADFAEKQAELEKEKQHAETTINNLRRELNRVQQYASAARSQSSRRNMPAADKASGASDEAFAKGWQLFGKCANEYAGMAEIADKQRNDLAEWQAYGKTVSAQ